ncbi:MAG: glycosyltransferase family 2 protein [bacterium]
MTSTLRLAPLRVLGRFLARHGSPAAAEPGRPAPHALDPQSPAPGEGPTPADGGEARPPRLSSLSIFFPCHNEEANVERVVRAALDVGPAVADEVEVIVVNDGSGDGTREIADRLAAEDPRVRAVHHPTNRGYGGALQSGFAAAEKDFVFFSDGDGQFDLGELPRLVALVADGEADLALGYRIRRADPLIRSANAALYKGLIRLLFGLRVRDIDCAFKLIHRKVLDRVTLKATGALVSAELLIKARKAGFRMREVGVHHYPREAGEQSGADLRVILRTFVELARLWRQLR